MSRKNKIKKPTHHTVKTAAFPSYERNLAWFGSVTLVFVVLVVAAILTEQMILAVILVLAAIVYFVLTAQRSTTSTITIGEQTISINKKTYAFDKLRWFRLYLRPTGFVLELQPLKHRLLPIGVHINDRDVAKIFAKLNKQVPYNLAFHETFPDKLMRWLRV